MTETNHTSARERIREAVFEAMDYADARHGYEAPGEWDRREDETTDRIIAIVREALLDRDTICNVYEKIEAARMEEARNMGDFEPSWMNYSHFFAHALANAAFGKEIRDE